MAESTVRIRSATSADIPALVQVATAALGWEPDAPNEALFRWKHQENPFGESAMWIAEVDGEIAGYRAFMRWELIDGAGRVLRAVRAVDTATHPNFQRRGIFTRLTTHGLDDMLAEGIDLVFNTPNASSRSGYLKMGWHDVGPLPVAFRPCGLRALPRLVSARTSAEKWSEASQTGRPASEVMNEAGFERLLGALESAEAGLSTPLSADFLRWRYRLEPLRYRAWAPDGIEAGAVFFRIRKRGDARECAIGHVLTPGDDAQRSRLLLQSLAKAVDADYLLRLGEPDLRAGFVPLPGQGPMLVARELGSTPPYDLSGWTFQLGDIELF